MVYEKKYSWRAGKNVSAQVAGKVMEEIEERDGCVTKEAFLEASRPVNSPTHKLFEWNDGVAAEKYRLFQSRRAIQDIVVTVVKQDEEPTNIHAFVNVVSTAASNKAEYMSIDVAMQDDEKRNVILDNAFEELQKFEQKYQSLVELSDIFAEIHKAKAKRKKRSKK